MMKRLKSATSILIAALTLSTIFVVGVAAFPQANKSVNPIKGITVTVKKNPGGATLRTTQTDAEGNFTMKDLEGRHDLLLMSEKHDGMDAARVELTLTGTTAGEFKRTISTRELAAGVVIPIEISARSDRLLTGHVTLLK